MNKNVTRLECNKQLFSPLQKTSPTESYNTVVLREFFFSQGIYIFFLSLICKELSSIYSAILNLEFQFGMLRLFQIHIYASILAYILIGEKILPKSSFEDFFNVIKVASNFNYKITPQVSAMFHHFLHPAIPMMYLISGKNSINLICSPCRVYLYRVAATQT